VMLLVPCVMQPMRPVLRPLQLNSLA
jgi:hypothetical protein